MDCATVVNLSRIALHTPNHQLSPRSDRSGAGAWDQRPSGSGLSDMSMTALLRRMEYDNITVHGFRSTFRDWAGETTSFPREVIEAALAHGIKDKTEAAYARSDLFDKRRDLMQAWAHLATPENFGANVIALS